MAAGPRSRPARPRGGEAEAGAGVDVPGLAARKAAARLLGAVIDKRTPLDGLTDGEHGHPHFLALDGRDRALVRAILATALRFRGTIQALIEARLDRPLPPNAAALAHILHVGAAQMLFLKIPDSAAVDLAVEHAGSDPRTRRFTGLVNAVLREIGRRKDRALPAALAANRDVPLWFAERLEADHGPGRAAAILAAHRVEPATDFTVRADPASWAETLGGIVLPTGTVRVSRLAAPVADLPGYAEGAWWVQDAAAALPARLLGDVAGLRVADLCAAPGGKTAQLVHAGAVVTSVELSASRARRLAGNLARLGMTAEIVVADLREWRPDAPFDAVLLDAPCSSTGTVRRHPDVPWTKSPEDIARLAELQAVMLDRAVDLARPGGLVVYANCSLDRAEGEDLVEAFLARRHDVEMAPVDAAEMPFAAGFIDPRGALRTTPDGLAMGTPELSGLDGFYSARLRRLARD